jgi:hypothetical protein
MIDGKAAVTIGSSLAGAIAFWAGVYGWGKWLTRPRPEPRPSSVDGDARLERIEIERLGESHRFTAKLLAERDHLPRVDVPPPPSPLRVITPH